MEAEGEPLDRGVGAAERSRGDVEVLRSANDPAAIGPAINLHASLLPRWRGAAPINWAILGGDTVTGNSVISIAQRMDAGLIYGQSRRDILPTQTAGELHDLLSADGPPLVFAASSIISYLGNVESDIVINVLPLSFDYGLYQLLMTTLYGGTLVLERAFTFPAAILKLMEREGVTGFPGVPTIFTMLLEMASTESATAETLRAAGDVYLLAGRLPRAMECLKEASDLDPNDAAILNDMAVGYLAIADDEGKEGALVDALGTILAAAKLDDSSPEILFNEALAFERVSLLDDARDAWQRYLDRDGASEWAVEARAHQAKLLEPAGEPEPEPTEPAAADGTRRGARVRCVADRPEQIERVFLG